MVFEMVHKGLLTPEEARNHADRNVLSRALGSHPQVEVSCWDEPFPIQAGDRFLLCSDGLHDLVTDQKMLALARSGELDVATESLVRAANENGGYDNISVILLEAVDASALRVKPAPTKEYQGLPALSTHEAAGWMITAARNRPVRIAPRMAIVAQALDTFGPGLATNMIRRNRLQP